MVRLTQKRQLRRLQSCLGLEYIYVDVEFQRVLGLINKPCADAYARLDDKYLVIEAKNTDVETALLQIEKTIEALQMKKMKINYGLLIVASLSQSVMRYREGPHYILQVLKGRHWENVFFRNVPVLVLQHSKLLAERSGVCSELRHVILHGGV